jgi:hypothetical protein
MKRINLFILLTIFILNACFADDTAVIVASGSPGSATMTKSNQIKMNSEDVKITLENDSYTIEADFELINYGPENDITIAFPQWQWGTREVGEFKSFESWTNGRPEKIEIIEPPSVQEFGLVKINKWFARSIKFKNNETIHTSIRYEAGYEYGTISYLFGTGSNWNGEISKIIFEIRNNSDNWINEVFIDGFIDYTKNYEPQFNHNITINNNDNETTIIMEHVLPEISNCLHLFTNHIPIGLISNQYIKPSNGWYYSTRIIPEYILLFRSNKQLRLERNLIFAGHGNIFKAVDINEWLQKYCTDFYMPTKIVTSDDFNPQELRNIKVIQDEESRRKGTN